MARLDPGASARWVASRAKRAASSLKSEYEAGRRGDESPVEPIFPTPREQLQALQRLLAGGGASRAEPPGPAAAADPEVDDEAGAVASALQRVDWQQVRAATAERTSDAAQAMRSMASQVDWGKVQPVAAQVSSALIAAVAAGRIPLGGPLGPLVAKALSDRGALAGRVGAAMQAGDDLPPDFRADVGGGDPGGVAGRSTAVGSPTAPLPRWEAGE